MLQKERKGIITNACEGIKKCLTNGIVLVIEYTKYGQVINFVDLDVDPAEEINQLTVIAQYEYIMDKDVVWTKLEHHEKPQLKIIDDNNYIETEGSL